MGFIDRILNRITMYRLVVYYLASLLVVAAVLSAFGFLPYAPWEILLSTLILVGVALGVNALFARTFKVQTNVESAYITALILALIIDPARPGNMVSGIGFLIWAAALAMASKYIIAIKGKHIFNPAAVAVAITAVALHQYASWWVGSASMLAFVVIGGLLVVRKVQREEVAMTFAIAALTTVALFTFTISNPFTSLANVVLDSPIVFFACIMLTEPLTIPPTKGKQWWYAVIVGIAFAPQVHLGSYYFTPETALLLGNVFSYIVSPKGKYVLTLKKKEEVAHGVYHFTFTSKEPLTFHPGQYLEWTLGHERPDNRGNRRYFTIASSPTEREIMLGVKFYDKPSTFKQQLKALKPGDTITAAQLSGNFTLPKDPKEKLVFIAGGIGITPFRSMLKYLADKNEKRSVVLLYSSATAEEVAYYDVFKDAAEKIDATTVFSFTDTERIDPSWKGHRGYINARMIAEAVPDYRERTFYISGPHSLVAASKTLLTGMGIPQSRIKTDFFPGLA